MPLLLINCNNNRIKKIYSFHSFHLKYHNKIYSLNQQDYYLDSIERQSWYIDYSNYCNDVKNNPIKNRDSIFFNYISYEDVIKYNASRTNQDVKILEDYIAANGLSNEKDFVDIIKETQFNFISRIDECYDIVYIDNLSKLNQYNLFIDTTYYRNKRQNQHLNYIRNNFNENHSFFIISDKDIKSYLYIFDFEKIKTNNNFKIKKSFVNIEVYNFDYIRL